MCWAESFGSVAIWLGCRFRQGGSPIHRFALFLFLRAIFEWIHILRLGLHIHNAPLTDGSDGDTTKSSAGNHGPNELGVRCCDGRRCTGTNVCLWILVRTCMNIIPMFVPNHPCVQWCESSDGFGTLLKMDGISSAWNGTRYRSLLLLVAVFWMAMVEDTV